MTFKGPMELPGPIDSLRTRMTLWPMYAVG